MSRLRHWLNKHRFEAALLAFLLMLLPAPGLYAAAQHGATGWICVLLAIVVGGNLLALGVK
jgi:hypothetical protein